MSESPLQRHHAAHRHAHKLLTEAQTLIRDHARLVAARVEEGRAHSEISATIQAGSPAAGNGVVPPGDRSGSGA